MSQRRKIIIALLIGFSALFIIEESYTRWFTGTFSHSRNERNARLAGRDTLRCTIYLPSYAGARVGYHYDMLKLFSKASDFVITYVPVEDTSDIWKMITDDRTDILAVNIISDAIPKSLTGKVCLSPQLTEMGEVWVMSKERCPWHLDVAHWLKLFKQQAYYSRFKSRFFPASQDRSPYDSLLRSASRTLEWDWRLLRSVMYQESKYRMNAVSPQNAYGLMQMKKSTARDMKVSNLFDPEESIKGSVRYFAFLMRNMYLSGLPEEEQINFILAAYNAGMTRIQNDRAQAAADGKNPDLWADVCSYSPAQTQKYVEIILERYHNWVNSSE